VLIIGDSHLKGSATNTNRFLNTKFSVTSFIKPGASVNELVSSQGKELNELGKKDVIVLSGGANDMDNINETKGSEVVVKIVKFMQTYNNTNIAILSIPHRFDLDKESRTNLAIQKINSKLREMTKLFRHVSMIEMESNSKDYTKHGLHFNKAGKDKLARSTANLINQIVLSENRENPVIILN
jgi:lysophospholipase L1-like esterase